MPQKSCECCLMPFSQDPGNRTSEKYCSLCFQSGKLNAEGVSLEDFKQCSYDRMRKRGTPFLLAKFFTFMIGFAPYWKQRKTQ